MLSKNQIKFVRSLELKKNRKREHLFVAEGPKVVGDLLKAGFRPHSIFSTSPRQDGQLVTEEELQRISFLQHPQEVLAVFEIPDSEHRPINPNGLSLALDGIQDPGNLGTLMRSAKAFDFNTIFLADGTCDIYNDKVIRSSQGSIFKLNFIQGDKIEFIKSLEKTYKVYNTNVRNGKDIRNVEIKGKVAIILGNEGYGVSDEINALALDSLFINMSNMESLNVGVAGSILMYEVANK